MLHLIVDCIKSSSLHFYNEISNVSLRSRSSLECCPEIDWGLRAAMKVLMKIKSPNGWHGGGDAVWLLSPLHHQNVPQKLPAGIKPGIKLEQSSTARALSVTKTTRRAKYSLIRLSRAAAA